MKYDVKVNHTASIELTEKEMLKIIKAKIFEGFEDYNDYKLSENGEMMRLERASWSDYDWEVCQFQKYDVIKRLKAYDDIVKIIESIKD